MKRYEMTAEYNRDACEDEVTPVESDNGDWIKFTDYQAATEAAKATAVQDSSPAELPIKTWQERIVGDMRTFAIDAAMKNEIADLRAALSRPVVPEGCKLVPIEPTAGIIKAMSESHAVDDEGEFPSLCDLIDFSGENKTRAAIKAAYCAAVAAAPASPQPVAKVLTDDFLDYHLNVILIASGSALRNYSIHKTKEDMRMALRTTILAAMGEKHE